ncbi:MAG: PAS domain-containing protein, partial [Pseudonocardia sp.]|nr:PAS domain-containing protein [Pseudonocardia sp.]
HEELLRARSEELSERVLENAEQLSAANRALAATNAALEEAQRIVTESEARTRHVTAMVPAHIAHMDRDRRYTFSNNQISMVFPGASATIIGRDCEAVLGADTFARIRPHLDRAMAGQPQVFEISHPPSGRRIRIALTPDQNGRGAYILSTDVTAEVQSREALTHAAKRALAAQLTSGLAHDFGNLLTIILGLQVRLARADLSEGPAQDVQATLAAARRGVTLLDGIAALTDQHEYHPQPVELSALLADLVAMTGPTLGKGVTLDIAADLPPGRLLLDPGALQDALLNLILNARHAMAGVGAIGITARPAGRWLEIIVTDTGPGFSPEALARGIPVLAADAGGVRDALGGGGRLVPPGDAAAFAGALRRWWADPALRDGMRAAARVRRERLDGWEVTSRCLSEVLQQNGVPG